jgi:hypothetical protein
VIVLPCVVFLVTRRVCRELQQIERVEQRRRAAKQEARA